MAVKTSKYRVVGVAATYFAPAETLINGKVDTVQTYQVGRFGEEIDLDDAQAKRLEDLGVVRPADSALGYDEMTVDQLKAESDARGITVEGSGANGAVLKTDYVNALNTYDAGEAGAVVTPGP